MREEEEFEIAKGVALKGLGFPNRKRWVLAEIEKGEELNKGFELLRSLTINLC